MSRLTPYNMYFTEQLDRNHDGYCLLYYVVEMRPNPTHSFYDLSQIIPYCLRSSEEFKQIFNIPFNDTNEFVFDFIDLRKRNITTLDLLSWSASIDLAENYQNFLDNSTNNASEMNILFHNCTSPWFGPFCRFIFEPVTARSYISLETIVYIHLSGRRSSDFNQVPCYMHHACQTEFLCLDWREICDKKMDCLDGSDEMNCWQLEIEDCTENEYRLYNGLCMPIQDAYLCKGDSDCITRKIADSEIDTLFLCVRNPTFICEERMCTSSSEFSCGDGQCVNPAKSHCQNGRSILFRKKYSSNTTVCINANPPTAVTVLNWCDQIHNIVSEKYEFPTDPILFGHVHIIFPNKRNLSARIPQPEYICYDEKLCGEFLRPTVHVNGLSCQYFRDIKPDPHKFYNYLDVLFKDIINVFQRCLVTYNETHYCHHSTMYRCLNSSKCISKDRLLDGIGDCPFNDDEIFNKSCQLNNTQHRMRCWKSPGETCLAPRAITDGEKNCFNGEDELYASTESIQRHISFQKICNGMPQLAAVLIGETYETDETKCDKWPCINTYSRCNRFWDCPNGADELNCSYSICSNNQHECLFINNTSKFGCLPIERANDKHIDCIGATDERYYCQQVIEERDSYWWFNFRCQNNTKCLAFRSLCDEKQDCPVDDDEIFCLDTTLSSKSFESHFEGNFQSRVKTYFLINNMPNYATQTIIDINQTHSSLTLMNHIQSVQNNPSIAKGLIRSTSRRCHMGLQIQIRLNDNTSRLACLCPPAYYGDSCEYQSQRISLSLKITAMSEWRTVFTVVVILIDDQDNIESHDYIDFLSIKHCYTTYDIYLLYSTRPKNQSKNYSIRIHAFNKLTLKYRASWIFSIRFSFLPVHHLPVHLTIPTDDYEPIQNCPIPCIHGQCYRYVNNYSSVFCRCEPYWHGIQCTKTYECNCASGSLCIGKSICLCPLGRSGPQCRLRQTSCDSYTCANGGQCIPADERYLPRHLVNPTCICKQGFSGFNCNTTLKSIRIDVSLHKNIPIPPSIFFHLITIYDVSDPSRETIMKKIGFDEDLITIYTSTAFNMVFAEMLNSYYLIILRQKTIISANISTQIVPSHRCASIHELFDSALANEHLLKRIKYYHQPCQKRSELVCFYDSVQICLCDNAHQTNCFEFNHNETYDCSGYNPCKHESLCFLDKAICPTLSFCVCHQCYFGSTCQFSTKGSTLSLDIILGYRITSNVSINQQNSIVKVAITVTTLLFVLGLLSNTFAFLVFRTKETRKVGCGTYLFVSSIISTVTMTVFVIKLALLLASKIGSIENRLFIQIQCISIDFILRVLLSAGDWLNTCVSIERVINVSKGVNFDKTKSKKIAKWNILIILFFSICTHIHDPIHRQLIDDHDEQRTWCVTQYSLVVQRYDSAINIIHVLVPFTINCISAISIIIIAARTRSVAQKKQSFNELLREQFHQHKHLLISSSILVLLALPRLIMSFLPGCMKSTRDSAYYLAGYFISFIPPVLLFFIFILPSQVYMKQFEETIKQIRHK